MAHETPPCPVCGSTDVARCEYGLFHMTPEVEEEVREGKLIIGGCCRTGLEPKWHCNDCEHDWPTPEDFLREPVITKH